MSEIKPALSEQEWVEELRGTDQGGWPVGDPRSQISFDGVNWHPSLHTLAALCLHGQPFGFTHEDVLRNRWAAQHWQRTLDAQGPDPSWDFGAEEMAIRRGLVEWHNSLADRISALLPPQEKP